MSNKAKKASNKKISLGDFQKMTATSNATPTSSSWADEMDEDEVFGSSTTTSNTSGTTTDLRSLIDSSQQQQSSSSPFGRRSYAPSNNQFEQGAEDRSSSWSRHESSNSGGFNSGSSFNRQEGSSFNRYESRAPAEQHEMPTEAPFILFIKNLPFQTTKDDVADFFEEVAQVRVDNVILPIDREREGRIKGRGYVEFGDLESLKAALDLNGRGFMGRNIFIDLTDPETAQKMTILNREGGFERSGGAMREPTIADQADSWRGNDGGARPNLFGRSSGGGGAGGGGNRQFNRYNERDDESSFEERRPRREREPEGPSFEEKFAMQRQRKQEERPYQQRRQNNNNRPSRYNNNQEIDESDPLFAATSAQTERPKLQLKERTVAQPTAAKTTSGSIFGEGKAWEETDELRNRVEKLAVAEKKSSATTTPKQQPQQSNNAEEDNDGFEQRIEKKAYPKKKGMDFANFKSRSSNRDIERSRSEPVAEKKEEKQTVSSGKKQDKPKTDNAWAALESVDE